MRLVIKLNAFVYESDSVPISCVICALERGGWSSCTGRCK